MRSSGRGAVNHRENANRRLPRHRYFSPRSELSWPTWLCACCVGGRSRLGGERLAGPVRAATSVEATTRRSTGRHGAGCGCGCWPRSRSAPSRAAPWRRSRLTTLCRWLLVALRWTGRTSRASASSTMRLRVRVSTALNPSRSVVSAVAVTRATLAAGICDPPWEKSL